MRQCLRKGISQQLMPRLGLTATIWLLSWEKWGLPEGLTLSYHPQAKKPAGALHRGLRLAVPVDAQDHVPGDR